MYFVSLSFVFMKKFTISLFLLLLIVVGGVYLLGYGYLLKAVRVVYATGHSTTFLDDYTYFDNRTISPSTTPQAWALTADYNKVAETPELQNTHNKYGTVAFLIIKGDSIWHERYFLDQPVSDFFPQYKEGLAAKLTVGDLSSMASGLDWDEAYYDPFSITTRAYFDEHFREKMLQLKITSEPGKAFKYLSGNTFLLGMVIEKATGKTLSDYLAQALWQPMGCESEALWQLDSEESGLEKAYCCIASNARDFARLGKLYRDHGKWNGKQLLDSAFVAKSVQPRFADHPEYGYGWWLLDYKGIHFFMMRGHLGQYVIVNPTDRVIIVRLGHSLSDEAPEGSTFSSDIYTYIDEAYKMINGNS